MLLGDTFGAVDHSSEDGDQFRSFVRQGFRQGWINGAFFVKQLDPQAGFVRLLEGTSQLRYEFPTGAGA